MLRNVITLAFNVALALYLFRGRCFDTRSLFCFSLLSFRFFIGDDAANSGGKCSEFKWGGLTTTR